MKKRNRWLALGLSVIMALSTLTGCGTKTEDSNADYEYDPSGEVELTGTFELQIFTGGYSSEPWEEIIADFEEEHPELDVVAYMDANVNKKMQTRWIQGEPADFVYLAGANLPTQTYMEEGKLLDLTSFYEKATIAGTDEPLKDHLKSNTLKKLDGKMYSVPISIGAYGIWYDEAYLQELGMELPTNYDELLAFGKTAKEKGVDTLIYPGTSSMYLVHALVFPACAVYGQEFLDQITTASSVDAYRDARFKDVLTRIKNMADAGMFSEGTVSLNHIQSQMQWLSHKALLIPNGEWLESEMEKDIPDGFKMRYAVPMMNKADEEQVIVTSSSQVGVASDGDNKEAALEFIRFMYREENMAKFAKYWNVSVATDADLSDIKLSETAQYTQQVLTDPNYKQVNLDFSWGAVDAVMVDCINQLVLGEITVDEMIDKLAATVEKQLADKQK